MKPFDTSQYLAAILPQAKQHRQASESSKCMFYEQIKRHIAAQGIPAQDYERIFRAVCDSRNF